MLLCASAFSLLKLTGIGSKGSQGQGGFSGHDYQYVLLILKYLPQLLRTWISLWGSPQRSQVALGFWGLLLLLLSSLSSLLFWVTGKFLQSSSSPILRNMRSLTWIAQVLRTGDCFFLSWREKRRTDLQLHHKQQRIRSQGRSPSFTQEPRQPKQSPVVGDVGTTLLLGLSKMEDNPQMSEWKKTQTHKPFSGSWRKSSHAKELFIFKIRLTELFVCIKWDSVEGTVWELTYPSGDWSWGIALRQRKEFILDLLVFGLLVYVSTC